MTDDDVHSGLVRWLTDLTAITVIKAYQEEERPSNPYLMVNMLGSSEVRRHEQRVDYVEDAPSERILAAPVIETEWQFSVHAYGDSPSDRLRPIRSAFALAQRNEPMMPLVILHSISQIRHVPDWVNERWERRAQIDVMVRGLVRDGLLIDTIEEYSFTFDRM